MTLFDSLRRPVAALLLATLGACHTLVPLQTAPDVNQEARVRLSDLGAAIMAPILGPGVTGVRGRIVSADSVMMRVSVVAVTNRDGLENIWLGEIVTVQRQHIEGFDKRELSPVRSSLVTVGILAGMVVLGSALSGGSEGILRVFGQTRGR